MPTFLSPSAGKLGMLALAGLVALSLASCSSKATNPAALEARELLDLLDGREGRLDLDKYAEVNIGSFRVALPSKEDEPALKVSFKLVAIVPESKKAHFEEELPKYEQRIREAAIALVSRTDSEQLAEPSLDYLKGEMAATLNRILQKRIVRDTAFSSFSLGYQWTREEDAPAKPKSGGHH